MKLVTEHLSRIKMLCVIGKKISEGNKVTLVSTK